MPLFLHYSNIKLCVTVNSQTQAKSKQNPRNAMKGIQQFQLCVISSF